MLKKTIEIATPGTRLSVANRQLVIERPDQPKATVPIEDLGGLVVVLTKRERAAIRSTSLKPHCQ